MARGPKKHLKRLAAPKHWMLDKLGGVFAVRPRSGPHKLRECLPLNLFLRNRLKYALNYSEVKKIMRQRIIKVDGKIRTDHKFPAGFMDVISIERTNETFRLLYDVKGRYTVHRITAAEGQFKLCKVKALHVAKKNIPYITTNDGRTIRYPDPHIKVNDTVVIDLTSNKITDFVKFEAGNLAMVTGGRNVGRVGVIGHREKLPGAFDIIHIKDSAGHSFATRVSNVFVIGKGNKALVSLPASKDCQMRHRLWKALNGLICVYKPVDLSITGLKRQIVKRICADGNEVVGMPRLPLIKMPIVEPHETSGALLVVGEKEVQDYTLHPLVCGEAFRPEDIRLEEVHYMESTSSGVCGESTFGPFHANHALLEKQISLQNIVRNIELCRRIMNNLPDDEGVVSESNSPYEEERDVVDGLDLQIEQEVDAMRPPWPRHYT
ncbi:Ribosomal family S4e [Ostertagia ostertagi]